MVLLTLNLLLGLLVSTNYNPARAVAPAQIAGPAVPDPQLDGVCGDRGGRSASGHSAVFEHGASSGSAMFCCRSVAGTAAIQLPRRSGVLRVHCWWW